MAEENGMWGGGYWGEGYWGDGYWGIYGAVAAVAEAVIGVFPTLLRRRFIAVIPMLVTIRRPVYACISIQTTIRSQWQATLQMERLVRRRFKESFTAKKNIVTPKFKNLMRTIYLFLKEEQS